MSKIFDALSKAQGEIASLALPLIDQAGKSTRVGEPIANIDLPQTAPPTPMPLPMPTPVRAEPKQPRFEDVEAQSFGKVVFQNDPSGVAADRFRLLRMRLQDGWAAGNLKSVLVTSPLPGEGKSTTAMNLATALAEERTRTVLLVDADLHRGSINKQLGLDPHVGLAECLQTRLNPLSCVRRVQPFGWYLLSPGEMPVRSPTELLQPQELARVFQKLLSFFDWVIVDSPPVLPLSDAVALRHHLDASLMVARSGVTSAKAMEDAMALLGRKHVAGVILNGIEEADHSYSAYYPYRQSAAGGKA